MSKQLGENSGVTGLITLHGQGTAPAPKPFNGKVEAWSAGLGNLIIDRSGPGTGGPSVRCEPGSGTLTISALVNKEGYPFPKSLEKVSGNFVLQWDTDVTVTLPVMITDVGFSQGQGKDQWALKITAALNGVPITTGFTGTQAEGAAVPGNQSLWAGRQKSIDPAGISDGETETIDVPCVQNSTSALADAEDLAKAAAIVASATPPRSDMKVIAAGVVRTGPGGCRVTLQYGYDDAADRIINSQRVDVVDPDGLRNESVIAELHNATDPQPESPSAPQAGLKVTSTQESVINNAKSLTVFRYGLRTSKEQIQNDGSSKTYSRILSENGKTAVMVESYAGGYDTWCTAAETSFFATEIEARSITFRKFCGDDTAGTVIVTRTFRPAGTSGVDFTGLYKVEPGAAYAYQNNQGVYMDSGTNPPTYKVFVLSNVAVTSATARYIQFGLGVSGVRRSFQVVRKATGAAPGDYASLLGKTNNGIFMGCPAGTVKYAGYAPKQISDTEWIAVYDLVYDSNGHIDRFGAVKAGNIPYNNAAPSAGQALPIPSSEDSFPYVRIAAKASLAPLIS